MPRLWLLALFVTGFGFSVFARRSSRLDSTEFYILLTALIVAGALILYVLRQNPVNEDDP